MSGLLQIKKYKVMDYIKSSKVLASESENIKIIFWDSILFHIENIFIYKVVSTYIILI